MSLSFHDKHPEDPNLMGYAEFELKEHKFQCWQPANETAKGELVIEVRNPEGKLILTRRVEMMHDNRWGVDVEDSAALESVTETTIQELGLE